ncbi:Rho crystallin, partial [Orchesella cincta]
MKMKDRKTEVDRSTNLETVWKALEAEVDAGRVKSLGISNFNADQAQRIVNIAKHKPMNHHQYETHAYFQQKALRKLIKTWNYRLWLRSIWEPWAQSFLQLRRISNGLLDPTVEKIAKKYNKTTAQILLRFLTQQGIVVIPKSVTPTRIQQNIEIFDIELTADEMKELEALDKGFAGRTVNFNAFKGEDHPEYPFKTGQQSGT